MSHNATTRRCISAVCNDRKSVVDWYAGHKRTETFTANVQIQVPIRV